MILLIAASRIRNSNIARSRVSSNLVVEVDKGFIANYLTYAKYVPHNDNFFYFENLDLSNNAYILYMIQEKLAIVNHTPQFQL